MKEECVENKKVFIVHGHDGELKYNVSHWLQKGGLEPIILHETANRWNSNDNAKNREKFRCWMCYNTYDS